MSSGNFESMDAGAERERSNGGEGDGNQSVDKGSCGGSCDGVEKVEEVHPGNKGAGHETLSNHRERTHRL